MDATARFTNTRGERVRSFNLRANGDERLRLCLVIYREILPRYRIEDARKMVGQYKDRWGLVRGTCRVERVEEARAEKPRRGGNQQREASDDQEVAERFAVLSAA